MIKDFLTPPVFSDVEKTRIAHTFHVFLMALSSMLFLAIPVALLVSNQKMGALIILLIALAVNLFTLQIARRGKVRLAIRGYLIYSWFNSATFIFLAGASLSTASGLFIPIIALATLFLGIRSGLVTTGLALIYLFVLVILNQVGFVIPQFFILTEFTRWIVFLFSSILVLIPLTLIHGNLLNALQTANKQLRQLQDVEITLRESEERFRLISSVISDYTFFSRLNDEGGFDNVLLTGALEAITGYSSEEFLVSGRWRSTLHPEDIAEDDRTLQILGQNKPAISKVRIIQKSGDIRWVTVYAHPIWDNEQNKLAGITGAVQDITERKRAEQIQTVLFNISRAGTETKSLRELLEFTHEQLQTLIPANNFYVALYDPKTELYSFPYGVDEYDTNWEPHALKDSLTDYVRRNSKPMIITGETHQQMTEELGLELIDTWSEVWIGAPLKTVNGVVGVIALQDYESSSAYKQEDLELLSYVSENIARVIESKRYELELQQYASRLESLVDERTHELSSAKERLELILNNTSDALAFAESNGDILIANPAFSMTFGDNVTESIEYILQSIGDDEHVELICDAMIKVINNKETQRIEIQIISKESESIDIDIALIPVSMNNGNNKNGILLSARDITHMKEVERLKSQFVDDAVHDLATPITGLSTRLYLLKRSPERLTEHLHSLENQVEHLRNLLDDLRTLSHLDQGKIVLSLEMCNINNIVKRVFDTYEPVAIEKQQSLIMQLQAKLPDAKLDIRQVERIIVNLLSNAINYTSEHKKITIETGTDNEMLIIQVTDEGMGISAEDLTHVFERFYRSDEARSNLSSGTGLGLAIAKEIVERHGGTISAESEIGKGSIFTVELPLV